MKKNIENNKFKIPENTNVVCEPMEWGKKYEN